MSVRLTTVVNVALTSSYLLLWACLHWNVIKSKLCFGSIQLECERMIYVEASTSLAVNTIFDHFKWLFKLYMQYFLVCSYFLAVTLFINSFEIQQSILIKSQPIKRLYYSQSEQASQAFITEDFILPCEASTGQNLASQTGFHRRGKLFCQRSIMLS